MKAVIATPKKPLNFDAFIDIVKSSASEGGNTILGYVVIPGPGCWNHGIMIQGADEENFVHHLAMVLQPAKWNRVADNDPEVSEGLWGFTHGDTLD